MNGKNIVKNTRKSVFDLFFRNNSFNSQYFSMRPAETNSISCFYTFPSIARIRFVGNFRFTCFRAHSAYSMILQYFQPIFRNSSNKHSIRHLASPIMVGISFVSCVFDLYVFKPSFNERSLNARYKAKLRAGYAAASLVCNFIQEFPSLLVSCSFRISCNLKNCHLGLQSPYLGLQSPNWLHLIYLVLPLVVRLRLAEANDILLNLTLVSQPYTYKSRLQLIKSPIPAIIELLQLPIINRCKVGAGK